MFGVLVPLHIYIYLFFAFFLSFFPFSLISLSSFVFSIFSIYLGFCRACICFACRVRYDGIELYCLLPLRQHYDVLLVPYSISCVVVL